MIEIKVPANNIKCLEAARAFFDILCDKYFVEETPQPTDSKPEPPKADIPPVVIPEPPKVETTPEPPKADIPTPAPDVELDVRGLPWDARIHANAKERKKQNGEWKRSKAASCTDELIAQVEAELRQKYPVQSATPTPPAPPTQSVESATPTPPAPPTQSVESVIDANITDFVSLMGAMTPYLTSGKLNNEILNGFAQSVELENFSLLPAHTDKIPQIIPVINQHLASA